MDQLEEFLAVVNPERNKPRPDRDKKQEHPADEELSLLAPSSHTSSSDQYGGDYEPQRKTTE